MKCIQANLQRIPRPTHLITNLAYRLKPHHTRNLYLRTRLDTCADVNIKPVSVYRLVFQDPNMKKLAPSNLEIGSYTTHTVKIVGSFMLYIVLADTKKVMDVTFLVATNDGTVLLSCKTTLMLGLIQPRTRLDYLFPRTSLITSYADHHKKSKSTLCVQKQEVSTQTTTQEVAAQMPTCKCAVPKLVTKIRFSMNTLMSLKGLVSSQDLHTTYRLIQVLRPSKLLAAQFLSTTKKHLNKK